MEAISSVDADVSCSEAACWDAPAASDWLEDDTMDHYNRCIQVCRECGDNTTLNLFQTIIDEEQVHYNYFDNVNDHIERLGNVYLAQIAGTPSSTGLATQGFVARQVAAASATA